MAPRTKKAADAIDKQRPRRRQHIILQTLPPVVLSTPANTITIRFAMSTAVASWKSDSSHSFDSASDPLSERQSVESTSTGSGRWQESVGGGQAQEASEDGKTSPSLSAIGVASSRQDADSNVSRREDADSRDPVDPSVFKHVQLLHTRINEVETSVKHAKGELRAEMKQQGDRVLKHVHDVEATMNEKFDKVDKRFEKVEEEMKSMRDEMKSMRDEMKSTRDEMKSMRDEMTSMQTAIESMQTSIESMQTSIKLILQSLQPTPQGVPIPDPPRIVEQPPSSHSHDDSNDDALSSLEFASDASQRSAAGPSSPQRIQNLLADVNDDRIIMSPSMSRSLKKKLSGAMKLTSEVMHALRHDKKGKGTSQ